MIFLVANFLQFAKNILQTDSLSQVPWSIECFWSKYKFLKIPQNCLNCLQYERVLKISYFHIFELPSNLAKRNTLICGWSVLYVSGWSRLYLVGLAYMYCDSSSILRVIYWKACILSNDRRVVSFAVPAGPRRTSP